MPLTKPAFFRSDRLPRWRALWLESWIRVRLRFRRNPGFVTAAAAGSIGLALALYLLLSGGLGGFGATKDVEPEVAVEPELGAPADRPAPRRIASVMDDREASDFAGAGIGGGTGRAAPTERGHDESGILIGTRPGKPNNTRTVAQSERIAFDEEAPDREELSDERSSAEESTSKEPEVAEPDVSEPPAIESGQIVMARDLPPENGRREEEDEPGPDADRAAIADDEPLFTRDEEKPDDDDPAPVGSKPALGALSHLAEDNDKSADLPQETRSRATTTVVTAAPAAKPIEDEPESEVDPFARPQPKASWKDSGAKPLPPIPDPDSGTTIESRAVETAVYASPEPAEASQLRRSPVSKSTSNARPETGANEPVCLALEIRGPRHVLPGETFELELIVTNTGREPVEGAILSVALPPGLVHPQGSELEQPIASIAGCERHRGRLKVKAAGGGELTARANVATGGKTSAKAAVTLRVGPSRIVRAGGSDACACEPLRIVR